MRVVLDCNVIVSFLISPGENISKIRACLYSGTYKLLISEEIFNEVKEILSELEFEGYINSLDNTNLIKFLLRNSENINVITLVEVCRDRKDNKYLSCAKDGKANYLVTGDEDLLILDRYKYSKIIKPSSFALILSALPNRVN